MAEGVIYRDWTMLPREHFAQANRVTWCYGMLSRPEARLRRSYLFRPHFTLIMLVELFRIDSARNR